jgi:hypothetical protein
LTKSTLFFVSWVSEKSLVDDVLLVEKDFVGSGAPTRASVKRGAKQQAAAKNAARTIILCTIFLIISQGTYLSIKKGRSNNNGSSKRPPTTGSADVTTRRRPPILEFLNPPVL